jgi:hypothetical protein
MAYPASWRGEAEITPPWYRILGYAATVPMLRGLVQTMSVADVLDWAERRRVSGTFVFERGAVTRRVAVSDGEAALVSSSHPAEHLGRVLVGQGYLTEEALAGVAAAGQPLGKLLVARGLVAEGDLRTVLEAKIAEALYEMMSWEDGSFVFELDVAPDRGELQVRVSLRMVLSEGEGRARLWRAVRERVPSDDARFVVRGAPGTGDDVVHDIARGLSVREVMLERRWLPFATYRALAELADRGVIALVGTSGAVAPARVAETARALLGRPTVPRLARPTAEVARLELGPAERALAARIDGRWDTMTLIRTAPGGETDALLALERLTALGVVKLDER